MNCFLHFSGKTKKYEDDLDDISDDCHDFYQSTKTYNEPPIYIHTGSQSPTMQELPSPRSRADSNSFVSIHSIDLQMDMMQLENISNEIITTQTTIATSDKSHPMDIHYLLSTEAITINILQCISFVELPKLSLISTCFYNEIRSVYHKICKQQIEQIPSYHIHHSLCNRSIWKLYLVFDDLKIKNCDKSLFVIHKKNNLKINPHKWRIANRPIYYQTKDNLTVLDLDISHQSHIIFEGKINVSHIPLNIDIVKIMINDTTHKNMNLVVHCKDNDKCLHIKNKMHRIILPNHTLHIKGARFVNNKIDFKYLHFNIIQYNNVKNKSHKQNKIELILDGNHLRKILNIHKLPAEITNIKIINQASWSVRCRCLQFSHMDHLIELNLSNNEIKGDIQCELPSFPKHLKHLNLSNNKNLCGVLDFKSKLFANCCNTIKEIVVENCSLTGIANFDFIPRTLNELRLNYNQIEVDVTQLLSFKDRYFAIKYVGLAHNKVHGVFTFNVNAWPHLLSVMDFSWNNITAHLDLSQWPDTLMALDLTNNNIDKRQISGLELIGQKPWKFDAFVYQKDE
eukprot:346571_1